MTGMTHQLETLEGIAAFSAGLRGHKLNVWRTREGSATAVCSKCGRSVTIYASLLQPDMDGAALTADCDANAAVHAA